MAPNSTQGFTYLGILFALALMSTVFASTATIWSQSAQREKERELIHIGNQFRRAIGLYYERSPGSVKRFPQTINDLLVDTRYLTLQRYLRRVYLDPMTGKAEWGYLRAPDGGIMGVHSLSEAEPIKVANFKRHNERFLNAKRYVDWQFVYVPATAIPQTGKPTAVK